MAWRSAPSPSDSLDRAWAQAFGGVAPLGYLLRTTETERWARIYGLPKGRRYPRNRGERSLILERHLAVLKYLVSSFEPSGTLRILVPDGWGTEGVAYSPDVFSGLNAPTFWRYAVDDSRVPIWATNVESTNLDSLGGLLLRVALEEIVGVVIGPTDLHWAYCPYDGGADVIVPTHADVAPFAERFRGWLSEEPTGL